MAKRPTSSKRPAKSQPKADRPSAPGYGIVGAEDGKGLLPWAWVARKMSHCRTFWLATIHASQGRPHVMPVWGGGWTTLSSSRPDANPAKVKTSPPIPRARLRTTMPRKLWSLRGWRLQLMMRRRWSGLRTPTRRNTRWIRGAWENPSSSCVRGWYSDLLRRRFRSRQRDGNCRICNLLFLRNL